jgi:hypothetical protein
MMQTIAGHPTRLALSALLSVLLAGPAAAAPPPDDAAQIQAAINAMARQGGGVVQLEPRTYKVARPLYLRDGVTLAGAGPATTITNLGLNSKADWGGAVVFAGNLVPLAFTTDGYGFPGHPAQRVGARAIDLGNCGGLVPSPGSVVWLSTSTVERGNQGMPLSRYAELNLVDRVDGCRVELADPVTAPTGEPIAIHWNEGHPPSWSGAPEIPIRQAGVRDLTLASAAGQALTVSGCYRCTFTNIVLQRSRMLFAIEGTRGSLFENISGNFTERGIELAELATENTVRRIRGTYVSGAPLMSRPAIRFGEYAFGNTLDDIVLDLRDGYVQTIKIRFDGSEANHLSNIKLLIAEPQRADTLRIYRAPGAAHERGDVLPKNTTLEEVLACYLEQCVKL